jgi:hypothetical protein
MPFITRISLSLRRGIGPDGFVHRDPTLCSCCLFYQTFSLESPRLSRSNSHQRCPQCNNKHLGHHHQFLHCLKSFSDPHHSQHPLVLLNQVHHHHHHHHRKGLLKAETAYRRPAPNGKVDTMPLRHCLHNQAQRMALSRCLPRLILVGCKEGRVPVHNTRLPEIAA